MSILIESLEGGVLTLTINRPKARNTINQALTDRLMSALQSAEADPNVRCIALTGAGNIFSAGGDVNAQASGTHFSEEACSPEEAQRKLVMVVRQGMEVSRMLHEIPKPTLAIISGAAAGAGLSLALACDLRFCLDTAKLTTAFSKVGLSGDSGGTFFLPYLVGAAKARELYFSADVILGQEAYEMGLVSKVAGQETFTDEARAYAEHLASLPTKAVGYIKQNLNAAYRGNLRDVFDLEAENIVRSMLTEDHKSAAHAFINKQAITFTGQ